jgi:hypothetical protein
MRINYQDDFGTEVSPCRELTAESLNSFFRYHLESMIEGISEGLLEGEADEGALRYFGLIA